MYKIIRKRFTKAEVECLRSNRHVEYVSPCNVRFTEAFKQHFLQQQRLGITAAEIFLSCGIHPDILGQRRVESFRDAVKRHARKHGEFCDHRKVKRRPVTDEEEDAKARIKQLEHELAYTRQELEFLKKVQMADTEARREWEAKHRPK
ncbi:MAG: hypothetical protein IJV18_02905 [Acidaminococcaceae bacterium]|nr:hypothetical protein [Acidaminococcaceae bacterium]MBQ9257672.1 hypothetical protein [Acidaminococcaceae bacterium]MBQ9319851.1 hypothetical protein [Acidaminococcaceae bacterium]